MTRCRALLYEGPWLLLPLLVGTGIFLTVRLGALQLRLFIKAISIQFGRRAKQIGAKGEISSFQAMSTALGATVGTGNIVSVALSIGIATMFALCCVFACFGVGNMAQSNAIAANLEHSFTVPPAATAITLAILTAAALLGGIKIVSKVAAVCVPLMIMLYLGFGSYIVLLHLDQIPAVLQMILRWAFTGKGAAGAQ